MIVVSGKKGELVCVVRTYAGDEMLSETKYVTADLVELLTKVRFLSGHVAKRGE